MKDSSTELILSCTRDKVLEDIISFILEKEGFRLIKAPDERLLFSLIEEYRPVVVIIDSGISGIMGYSPWEIIRKINRFKEIKIVLITSVSLQYVDGAYDHADEVIERDLVNEHILTTIKKFILPGETPICNRLTKEDENHPSPLPSPLRGEGQGEGVTKEFLDEDVQAHEDARRLARAIVSDIVYYNSEAALRGASDGIFFDLLSKEIEEGRILYQNRVPLNILAVSDYYDCAIRDFILKIQQCNLVLP